MAPNEVLFAQLRLLYFFSRHISDLYLEFQISRFFPTDIKNRQISASQSGTGLPDGIFSNQKSHFGKILEGLAMEDV
jgi:hypothetical protein